MNMQHDVSISGGKDSQAVACKAVERANRKGFGNMPPRFFFADTGNEHELTIEHVAYLSDWLLSELGVGVTTLSAYSVPGLIDEAAFARKREVILNEWPKEKRVKRHARRCDKAIGCDCPIQISPAVPEDLIARAVAALQPTGIAFLDMAMLHGRFPGARSRFCTDELKLAPLMQQKLPLFEEGVHVVSWLGERADESMARATKPPIQSIRRGWPGIEIIYRPIHAWTAEETLAFSARFGLRHNPLYLMGMNRVGCMPCIMCKKGELRQIALRFPEHIDKIEEWERITCLVSRRFYAHDTGATFFAAKMVPGEKEDETRANIRAAVRWASTTRGGKQFDMMAALEQKAGEEDGWLCESAYGLCE